MTEKTSIITVVDLWKRVQGNESLRGPMSATTCYPPCSFKHEQVEIDVEYKLQKNEDVVCGLDVENIRCMNGTAQLQLKGCNAHR